MNHDTPSTILGRTDIRESLHSALPEVCGCVEYAELVGSFLHYRRNVRTTAHTWCFGRRDGLFIPSQASVRPPEWCVFQPKV